MSMKDIIKEKVSAIGDKTVKLNVMREFIQALILKFIEGKGYFKDVAFMGAAALRLLFGLRRYTDDLDLSLIKRSNFDLERFIREIEDHFTQLGLTMRAIKGSLLKFGDVGGRDIFIDLRVDRDPPAGFLTDVSFMQKPVALNIVHFNKSSLFAGKLHAALTGQHAKGLHFYDLMWFLGEKTFPNYVQLQNAMYQTTGQKFELNADKLKELLLKCLPNVDWQKAAAEVTPFLVDRGEARYLMASTFEQLIERANM